MQVSESQPSFGGTHPSLFEVKEQAKQETDKKQAAKAFLRNAGSLPIYRMALFEKTQFFITTASRVSNPTRNLIMLHIDFPCSFSHFSPVLHVIERYVEVEIYRHLPRIIYTFMYSIVSIPQLTHPHHSLRKSKVFLCSIN